MPADDPFAPFGPAVDEHTNSPAFVATNRLRGLRFAEGFFSHSHICVTFTPRTECFEVLESPGPVCGLPEVSAFALGQSSTVGDRHLQAPTVAA